MKKAVKQLMICLIMTALFWCGMLILDKNRMREELIRLHVVANSNDPTDQTLKLCVCDAVIEGLQNDLKNICDADQVKQYIESRLPNIRSAAENALKSANVEF